MLGTSAGILRTLKTQSLKMTRTASTGTREAEEKSANQMYVYIYEIIWQDEDFSENMRSLCLKTLFQLY